jgi:signal transduction histidine kinase
VSKEDKWPFIPDHISNDKPELTGQGIVSNRHLEGYETIIFTNLDYPTVIVEFSLDGNPAHTASRLNKYLMRRPCARFREFTGKEHCEKCDTVHALLFHGLTKQGFTGKLKERLENSEDIRSYKDASGYNPRIVSDGPRVYLEYDCPLLGYREVVFPIFFEDKIIATITLGQICLRGQGHKATVSEIQRRFFSSHTDCFDRYSVKMPGYSAKKCTKEITEEDARLWRSPERVLSDKEYDKKIKDAVEEIERLEETLKEQVGLKRDTYVGQEIGKALTGIHKDMPRTLDIRKDHIKELWRNVGRRLEALVEAFGFKYAAIFATSRPFHAAGDPLPLVVSVGSPPWGKTPQDSPVVFDASSVPESLRNDTLTSTSTQVLLDGLSKQVVRDENSVTILTYPMPFHTGMPLIAVIGHDEQTEPDRFEILINGLRTCQGVVVAILASHLEALAEQQTRVSHMIFGHEMGQLTPGLEWIAKWYLTSPKNLKALSPEKAEDLCQDIKAYVAQLRYLSDNAARLSEMMWALPEAKKIKFLAVGELLHKWKDIYRLEIVKKAIQVVAPHALFQDRRRPSVWGDRTLLEQLLYNLINNAVKYCYRGSKIYLDCHWQPGETSHTLTVTDYGREMPPGESWYDLFEKGVETEAGLGIGLFLARQIALSHGGKISHKSNSISDFNVPLIEPYLNTEFPDKELALCRKLQEELVRFKKNNIRLPDIVAMGKTRAIYEPSEDAIATEISWPTFKVTISVTIPGKED